MEEARRTWCQILGEQIDVTPWTDLFGVEHAEEQKRSWLSFMDCITFHLLMVFWSEVAETQAFYPGILHQQRVEEAKSSPNLIVCAKSSAAQWLLESTALSILLRASHQAYQSCTVI